ncbi:hypothetical protein HPC38_01690 [Pasteurellaceae bacterium HPA106]|uniref:hypothetical protein n=1 Tax=Spirabiliibacterium pneumoniae TaxID=221400 RepID=UPI001AAD0FDB|nr:hypothetical protein [Spirabiliibacterium pneumoniae]MBE2895588.1 hypothetical protein [Spirabiliibacterium pneumoniae]
MIDELTTALCNPQSPAECIAHWLAQLPKGDAPVLDTPHSASSIEEDKANAGSLV